MRIITPVLLCALVLASFNKKESEEAFVKRNMETAATGLKAMLDAASGNQLAFPRSTSGGKMTTTNMYDWTPGFFPGSLWYTAAYNKDAALTAAAKQWTEGLEPLKTFTKHHDLGFMMFCSYGNAYRVTGNETYKKILIESARSLSTRFSPVTGSIKSWNSFGSWGDGTKYYFPVIVDNLMNLELLFFATKASGDTSFRHVAMSHALTAMQNQVRPDYSTYHVVCYDTLTGKVITRQTAQGFADNSTWARGQAWAIYGFTMSYRESGDARFLKTAQGLADWFISNKNLPADKIPYWDFNVGETGYKPGARSNAVKEQGKYRDVSSAAITASALLELSTFEGPNAKKYYKTAVDMLHALAGPAYHAAPGTNGNFLLMHSVGSIPHKSEIDVPLVYADYYFVEALTRYNNLLEGKPVLSIK